MTGGCPKSEKIVHAKAFQSDAVLPFPMPEYMLLIRNDIDHQADWTADRHVQYLKECEAYILKLKKDGKIVAAQPLVKEGAIISQTADGWNVRPMRGQGEVQVGYYHVLTKDMDEAIEMAKGSPEFAYGKKARIEIRPVRTNERDTGFVYPR